MLRHRQDFIFFSSRHSLVADAGERGIQLAQVPAKSPALFSDIDLSCILSGSDGDCTFGMWGAPTGGKAGLAPTYLRWRPDDNRAERDVRLNIVAGPPEIACNR